jgi:hypothetical protein
MLQARLLFTSRCFLGGKSVWPYNGIWHSKLRFVEKVVLCFTLDAQKDMKVPEISHNSNTLAALCDGT